MRFDSADTFVEAPIFNEVLTPVTDGVGILASYPSDYYAGSPRSPFTPWATAE